jgi:putative ATP-grasp target RiPP
MRPFPVTTVLGAATVVLDPESQTGRWVGPGGLEVPMMDRHKRTETSKETKTRTSPDGDGNADEGSDQDGDTD